MSRGEEQVCGSRSDADGKSVAPGTDARWGNRRERKHGQILVRISGHSDEHNDATLETLGSMMDLRSKLSAYCLKRFKHCTRYFPSHGR